MQKANIRSLVSKLGIVLQSFLVMSPFVATLKEQNQQKDILMKLSDRYLYDPKHKESNIFWFSDHTLQPSSKKEIAAMNTITDELNHTISYVTLNADASNFLEEGNLVLFPSIYEFPVSFENMVNMNLKLPSILKALEFISQKNPTQIVVSTIGPMGLLGLLIANLMHIPAIGIYQRVFSNDVKKKFGK